MIIQLLNFLIKTNRLKPVVDELTRSVMESRIDLSKPQYDQNTYWGRVSHFSKLTDPRNLALSGLCLVSVSILTYFQTLN